MPSHVQEADCPIVENGLECPRRRYGDKGLGDGEWPRTLFVVLATAAITLGGSALLWVRSVDVATQENRDGLKAVKESTAQADTYLQQQINKNEDRVRADLEEIKQDVKKLLQRGR